MFSPESKNADIAHVTAAGLASLIQLSTNKNSYPVDTGVCGTHDPKKSKSDIWSQSTNKHRAGMNISE
jgi:hypothetical protein